MVDKMPPFCLWRNLLDRGGILVVSTYDKYNGGLSPRDVLASTRVLTSLSRYGSCEPIEARSFLSLEPKEWNNHLILIGGLLSNQVTRAFLHHSIRGLQGSFELRREMLRDLSRLPGRDCLIPTYARGLETNVAGVEIDYGLITVQPNPLDLEKRLYMLAGIKGWGGMAAATVFSSWEYYRVLNTLFEKHFNMTSEEVNRCPMIEIVVRTEIGSVGNQGMRDLRNVSVELVRVNGDPNAQWVRLDSRLQWGPKPSSSDRPDRRQFPGHLSVGLNERVAVIEFSGAAFAVRFDESRLMPHELDQFDFDMSLAVDRPDWRVGVKTISDRLFKEMPKGLAELLNRMQVMNVRPEYSWVRFVTPREYLRAPFECLHTGRDYLVLEYPVFRAISNAFSVRMGLSSTFLEDLKLRNMSLRVLLVASDPSDTIRAEIDQEIKFLLRIRESMEPKLREQVKVDVIWAGDATRARLKASLSKCPYHIFHYAGHSDWVSNKPEQSALLVSDNNGAVCRLSAAELASWVRDSELRFCFLSSCEGVRSDTERQLLCQDFLGLGDALIQAGVPEVLGFRWPVSSGGASFFAQYFYQALFGEADFETERALLLARRKVAEQDRDDLTWLSPILVAQK